MTPLPRPLSRLALSLASVAVLAAIAGPSARAHSWYPVSCCSGFDCREVRQSTVKLTSNGWFVVESGETIPFEKAQYSPDGKFHRCSPGGKPNGRTICLFVPGAGS